MVPSHSKGPPLKLRPVLEAELVPVQEMVPAYLPPDPAQIIVALPAEYGKDHVIHGRPDLAPGLPFELPVESVQLPNWRPVAIVKPPQRDPQFRPKFQMGKEPGPLFDRPMQKVGNAASMRMEIDPVH